MGNKGRGAVIPHVRRPDSMLGVARRPVRRVRSADLRMPSVSRPQVDLSRLEPGIIRRRRRRRRLAALRPLALGAVAGAALEFFLDPRQGRRRRHAAFDRTGGTLRRLGRRLSRGARFATSLGRGKAQAFRHRSRELGLIDDGTLADKVRSEVLGDPRWPKGRVNVQAYDGIVELRGELEEPELIEELVERVRRVHGVRGVENLLHVPGTPAPTHTGGRAEGASSVRAARV
jgi:hypothetical protein